MDAGEAPLMGDGGRGGAGAGTERKGAGSEGGTEAEELGGGGRGGESSNEPSFSSTELPFA